MFLFFLLSVIFFEHTIAQDENDCKSIYKRHFKKAEKTIKKQIRQYRNGTSYFNGVGSGNQIIGEKLNDFSFVRS